MSTKYTALPSRDRHDRRSASTDSSSSSSSPPPPKKPLYLPPYEADSLSHFTSFITDIEEDAPQRPRYRRAADSIPAFDSDPRFKMETPSPITRAALLALVGFLFWLAFNLRKGVWIATGMGTEKQDMETVDLSY